MLQATPLLRALKQRFTAARLVFVTARQSRALVERFASVDEVLSIDDGSLTALAASTARALISLARRRPDLYFDLEAYSAAAGVVSLLSRARTRLSFYRHSATPKQGLATHLVYFNPRWALRTLYLQMGVAVGTEAAEPDRLGPIEVAEEDRAGLRRTLGDQFPVRPYVVINPNASDLLLERRWPAERFAVVIEALAAEGHRLVLVGGGQEAAYVGRLLALVSASARQRVTDTSARLRLGELLALLEGAACVVTNDSGPMHMAVALGRPTVALFGPGSPSQAPSVEWVERLYQPVFCSPCVHEVDPPPCGGDNACMKLLEPQAVIDAARRLLAGGSSTGAEPVRQAALRLVDASGAVLGLRRDRER